MSITSHEQAEHDRLMKRLQVGTTNYNAANDLHAECYGTIGKMWAELERLRLMSRCGCGDHFTAHDPGQCGACVAGVTSSLHAELERLGNLVERLKQEAKIHAQEARTANATIAEIYAAVTGNTGEPGNWNGARPVVAELERLRAENAALRKDATALRTVMVAAAEEIALHWSAHCDAEGYGPANLMHRLESGIPSEYGYTAGEFSRLRAEVEALRKDLQALRDALSSAKTVHKDFIWYSREQRHIPTLQLTFEPVPAGSPNTAKGWSDRDNLKAAIDAAMEQSK